MGYTAYNEASRTLRADSYGYHTKSVDEVFTQQKERKIHDSMSPKGIDKRECFDSEAHPNSLAIVLSLDVTGSMRSIPHSLIKDGLPTLMSKVIQNGAKDASLLFLAVGDHECDRYPLQVGQFESGDAELDLWLTRTYLEGGGGGNAGESYLLAWYFAAFHTNIDCFNKRGQKGFLITIGDEPGLKKLPSSAIKGLMGTSQATTYTDQELLEAAQKMYNVYHIVVLHSGQAQSSLKYWRDILGQNCLTVDDHTQVAAKVADLVCGEVSSGVAEKKEETTPQKEEKVEEFL